MGGGGGGTVRRRAVKYHGHHPAALVPTIHNAMRDRHARSAHATAKGAREVYRRCRPCTNGKVPGYLIT